MKTLCSIGRRIRRRLILSLGLLGLLLALLVPVQAALAHPLDIYLQATYITVSPAQVVVELDLTPGVLVAPQALALLDADGDQQIADAEGRAYAETIVRNVAIQVDGQPLALAITKIDMPEYLVIQAGYGTIRVFTSATLAAGLTGTHAIAYSNNNAPAGVAYQVNTFVENGAAITLGKQNRSDTQQSIAVDYTIGDAAASAAPSATASVSTTGATGQAGRLLAYLDAPTFSAGTLLVAVALAVLLGGLHALTPGHGKTLVAAYLVGSRGTVRHAALLGAVVTFTHTASVIVIGLLALFASQFVVPGVLVPLLQVVSGVLVVWLGARLVWQRWRAFRSRRVATDGHDHAHDHEYPTDQPLVHDHGDGRVHSHLPPAEGFKVGSVAAMGVSGGLVPCPEALGVMIVAIGLNRALLGLGLIVAFSVGLAAVLIGLGILLVRARALVERFGGRGGRWTSVLPLASAVIVTVLGIGIVLSGLTTYLG
ncbi:MAG: hypothetical protein U0232_18325 [Thermomicrobiales bacterium]